ncbi:2'-5' RNA ligase family protein [Streptomyces lavendulocolor]|uniref:2'-5' RNA ligase family protein n=1 Tax=Streptomyces lavendulocolor TaxID=67316 RepID=UPI003C2B75F4
MHTVELLPDPATEGVVREVWRALAARGLPSLDSHRHGTNRPHLTLAAADELPGDARRRLEAAMGVLPLPLCLAGTLRFTGRTRVLAWRVVPGPGLLGLHRAVWDVLHPRGGEGGNPLHAPGRWVPHITLGRTRSRSGDWAEDLLPAALGLPWNGMFTGARTYDSVTRTTAPLRWAP